MKEFEDYLEMENYNPKLRTIEFNDLIRLMEKAKLMNTSSVEIDVDGQISFITERGHYKEDEI